MTKKIYKGGVHTVGLRGAPSNKVAEQCVGIFEGEEDRRRSSVENARIECLDRSKWRLLSWPLP